MTFIRVTDMGGHEMYLNVHQIVTIEGEDQCTRVDLAVESKGDRSLHVRERPEDILTLIRIATK